MDKRIVLRVLSAIVLCSVAVVPPSCKAQQKRDGRRDHTVQSLLGETLVPIEFSTKERSRLQAHLLQARKQYAEDPDNVENIIWLGRRTAYLWQYHDAIDIFTRGIQKFTDEPRLFRHRGHRWITVREFDKAITDLERARKLISDGEDAIEPDGQPNAANQPTSTLFTNIYYHLGLAYYLKAEFAKAYENFNQCRELAANDDMLVASTDWTYMCLRRLGRDTEAERLLESIHADMEILENFAYHRRLQMYQGKFSPSDLLSTGESEADRDLNIATFGYSIGFWYLVNGEEEKALQTFREVIDGKYWPAFGYIASEAELARMADED